MQLLHISLTTRYPVIPFTSGRSQTLSLAKLVEHCPVSQGFRILSCEAFLGYFTLPFTVIRAMCTSVGAPAPRPGFEPRPTVPETVVLPLHHQGIS